MYTICKLKCWFVTNVDFRLKLFSMKNIVKVTLADMTILKYNVNIKTKKHFFYKSSYGIMIILWCKLIINQS